MLAYDFLPGYMDKMMLKREKFFFFSPLHRSHEEPSGSRLTSIGKLFGGRKGKSSKLDNKKKVRVIMIPVCHPTRRPV